MKKEKFLILLAGSPGTGKSYLMNLIQEKIGDMYVITPDEIKVYYAESIGFESLEERAIQEKEKVWPFFYKALDMYMEAGKKVVASEYPFSNKQKVKLENLSKKYDYQVITIRLVADFETLWNRRYTRDRDSSRHLSYVMKKYHYGDTLSDMEQATSHITKEEFHQIVTDRKYDKFELGSVYEIDVSDYSQVNYDELLLTLSSIINK